MAEQQEQKETATPALLRRRWLRWSLALVISLLILVTLLPEAIRYGAIRVLQDQGFQQVAIDDVDLNLFTGRAGLSDVNLSGDGKGHAHLSHLDLNLAMLSLFSKQLELEQLDLNGLELDLQQDDGGGWSVAGWRLPSANSAETKAEQPAARPWGIGVQQLQLAGVTVHLRMPKLQSDLGIDQLQLDHLASWQPQQAASYEAQLHIDQAPLTIKGTMQPFATTPLFAGQLELKQLPLALADSIARDAGVEKLRGELGINSEFDARVADGSPRVKTDTKIELSGLGLRRDQANIKLQQLAWQGEFNYSAPTGEQDTGVRAKGDLSLQGFSLPHDRASLALAGMAVSGVAYDGRVLAIKEVTLTGLDANLLVNARGEFEPFSRLSKQPAVTEEQQPAETAPENDNTDSRPFSFQLAHLQLSDDSRIHFRDESIKPAFEAEVKPLSLTVTNIDTADKDKKVRAQLHATINGHEEISVTAVVRPFGAKLNMQGESKITALDLPPLSPYANRAMGYYLKRGQLNSSMKMNVVEDQLKADVHIVLNKFNIEEGDPARHKSFSESLSMPLDAALDLLRDKQDNIMLDVSVDGDIKDPQFDVSKVINKAVANATKFAVTTYLKFMLQPWGAMLMAAEMVGKTGTVSLDPISFAPAQTDLDARQQEYLDKIAALLQERPDIALNICGLASEQDRQALLADGNKQQAAGQPKDKPDTAAVSEVANERLLELATQRGELVKQELIRRGIAVGRLFDCHPNMDGADTNPSQVNLFL
jgi:outer membrane protein OmpA-like peptidoglycan-associated protein